MTRLTRGLTARLNHDHSRADPRLRTDVELLKLFSIQTPIFFMSLCTLWHLEFTLSIDSWVATITTISPLPHPPFS